LKVREAHWVSAALRLRAASALSIPALLLLLLLLFTVYAARQLAVPLAVEHLTVPQRLPLQTRAQPVFQLAPMLLFELLPRQPRRWLQQGLDVPLLRVRVCNRSRSKVATPSHPSEAAL
jgi:hypothetical protein